MNEVALSSTEHETFERARRSRDARFDGRFFVGVITTGIYCRPVCPAKTPHTENVRYFASAAGAAQAGFRPCLRCRPECAPGSPAWQGTSATVRRALRLIDEGALDHSDVPALAARLGVTPRHLDRLFASHVGASPLSVARTARLQLAKRLMDDTDFSLSEIALMAGFRSVRSFNHAFQMGYGSAPSKIRRRVSSPGAGLTLKVSVTRPYPWNAMLAYLQGRLIPGVEMVTSTSYARTISIGEKPGRLQVGFDERQHRLIVHLDVATTGPLAAVMARVRDQFDADAPVDDVAELLGPDPVLGPALKAIPGIRVPGAWSGFELAVRAILGQQVSVVGANTTAGKIARQWGTPMADALPDQPTHLFPSPGRLAALKPEQLPVPQQRARAIIALARAVAAGDLDLSRESAIDATAAALLALPGIGPWTCDYVRMRALRDPDAFPEADLGLRKALGKDGPISAAAAAERAERWRPWRSYAAMALWQNA